MTDWGSKKVVVKKMPAMFSCAHRAWPKGTLHASYAHAAYMGYGPQELERFWNP